MQIGSTWYAYSAVKVSNGGDPRDPHAYGRFCLTVASAPSPLGPFRDITGSAPLQCQPVATDPSGSIDPYPYHDPATGGNYLLWKAAGKVGGAESALMAQPLGSNGMLLPASQAGEAAADQPGRTLGGKHHREPVDGHLQRRDVPVLLGQRLALAGPVRPQQLRDRLCDLPPRSARALHASRTAARRRCSRPAGPARVPAAPHPW